MNERKHDEVAWVICGRLGGHIVSHRAQGPPLLGLLLSWCPDFSSKESVCERKVSGEGTRTSLNGERTSEGTISIGGLHMSLKRSGEVSRQRYLTTDYNQSNRGA